MRSINIIIKRKYNILVFISIFLIPSVFGFYCLYLLLSNGIRFDNFFSTNSARIIELEDKLKSELIENGKAKLSNIFDFGTDFCIYEIADNPLDRIKSEVDYNDKNIVSNIGPLFLHDNDWYVSILTRDNLYYVLRMDRIIFPYFGTTKCDPNLFLYLDLHSRKYEAKP